MDKEKEIDDTEEVIEFENDALVWCEELQNICCGDEISCANCIARHLYEAGYRKADVVRKETAKEIYERVDKWLDVIVPHTKEETILICLLGWIKTKFGIEVDE